MTAALGASLERYHDDRIHDGERADTNGRELNPVFVTRSRMNPLLTRETPFVICTSQPQLSLHFGTLLLGCSQNLIPVLSVY